MGALDSAEFWSDMYTHMGSDPFWLYCVVEEGDEETGPCKVGIANNPSKRLSNLRGGNWRQLKLVWVVSVSDRAVALSVEQTCLAKYRPDGQNNRKRLASEWIDAHPGEALETISKVLGRADYPIKRYA